MRWFPLENLPDNNREAKNAKNVQKIKFQAAIESVKNMKLGSSHRIAFVAFSAASNSSMLSMALKSVTDEQVEGPGNIFCSTPT